MYSCRFTALSLDKLVSNSIVTSEIQCDKCNGDMELVNICSNYIAFVECKEWKTKKTKDFYKKVLKKNFDTLVGIDVVVKYSA